MHGQQNIKKKTAFAKGFKFVIVSNFLILSLYTLHYNTENPKVSYCNTLHCIL